MMQERNIFFSPLVNSLGASSLSAMASGAKHLPDLLSAFIKSMYIIISVGKGLDGKTLDPLIHVINGTDRKFI